MSEQCQKRVYGGGSMRGHTCTKKVSRDGYCAIHHPDAVKIRAEKSAARYATEQESRNRQNRYAAEIQRKGHDYDRLASERDRYRKALEDARYEISASGMKLEHALRAIEQIIDAALSEPNAEVGE